MRYVLLLRGVNVGGNHKVSMRELKEALAAEGFEQVDSYINSGNLFFDSSLDVETCVSKIADVLARDYDFPIPFALVSKKDYLDERSTLPSWWKEDLARKDVLFFSDQFDKSAVLDFIDKATFYNEIVYVGNLAVFWGKYDESEFLKSTYHKQLIKQSFYKQITIRNGNTFEKIAEILEREE